MTIAGLASEQSTRQADCRYFSCGSFLAISLIISSTPAIALQRWQPSGPWSVQMQGDHCVAGQAFTSNSKQLQLVLEPNPTGPDFAIYIISAGSIDGYGWIHANVGIGRHWTTDTVLEEIPSSEPGHTMYKWGFPAQAVAELASSEELEIISDALHVDLPVTNLGVAEAGLHDCDAKLLAQWGFTLEQQAKIARYPTMQSMSPQSSDYPRKELMRDAVGNVDGYVTVNVNGRASQCHVVDSSGWPEIDVRTCELMVERAVLTPASDKDGRPIQAPFYFQFEWTGNSG